MLFTEYHKVGELLFFVLYFASNGLFILCNGGSSVINLARLCYIPICLYKHSKCTVATRHDILSAFVILLYLGHILFMSGAYLLQYVYILVCIPSLLILLFVRQGDIILFQSFSFS